VLHHVYKCDEVIYLVKFLEYLGEGYHIQRTTKKIEYVVRNKTSLHMGPKNKGTYGRV